MNDRVQENTVHLIDDADFDQAVLETARPVLVDFTATWAQPCRALSPALAGYAAAQNDVAVAKIDVGGDGPNMPTGNPVSFERYDIRVFPTLLLFRGGKIAGMAIGAMDQEQLATWTNNTLKNPPERDIAPEQFRDYSAQFYDALEKARVEHAKKLTRKVTLGVSAFELAGAGLITALSGAFGAAVAGPMALHAVWRGAQALRRDGEISRDAGGRGLNLLFNLSASTTGMAMVMAPAAHWGIKAACIAMATYFMATGGIRLLGDIGNLLHRAKKPDAPPPPQV